MKPSAKRIISRYQKMKAMRSTWESHWQECADYVVPNKNQITTRTQAGAKNNVLLYDSTAIQAAELLAGALHGMLTNPTTVFFDLTTDNELINKDDTARRWLSMATRKIHDILNNSNFQTEVHELYLDLCWAGTACMLIEEDDTPGDENQLVRFSTRHIAEVNVEENHKGQIDTVYRSYRWNARQIMDEFQKAGDEQIPDRIVQCAKDHPTKEFEIIHAVYPRDADYIKGKTGPKFYPYASVYVLSDGEGDQGELLRDSGQREFPYAVPRWTKASGEIYGRSPTMSCLPDIKMVNEMMLTVLKGAQKAVDPPLQAPDDGFLGEVDGTPSAINFYRAGTTDRIEPIVNNQRVDIGIQLLQDVRGRIRSAFYVDQLQLQNGPQMTATEVMQRTEEKLRLMGPMLGRQQSEFLRPMLDRVFNILVRKKAFGEIPSILSKATVHFQYTSAVAKAQKVSEGNNIMRFMQTAAPFLEVDQEAKDNVDADEAVRFLGQYVYGLPQELLRDKKKIAERRQGRQDAMQAQQQAQAQAEQAAALGKAAPAMQLAAGERQSE